jgi:hypothetical protein
MDTPYFSRRLLRAKFCNSREDEKEEKKKKIKNMLEKYSFV